MHIISKKVGVKKREHDVCFIRAREGGVDKAVGKKTQDGGATEDDEEKIETHLELLVGTDEIISTDTVRVPDELISRKDHPKSDRGPEPQKNICDVKVRVKISQDKGNEVDRFPVDDFIRDVPEHSPHEKRKPELEPLPASRDHVHEKHVENENDSGERSEGDHANGIRKMRKRSHDEALIVVKARKTLSPLLGVVINHHTHHQDGERDEIATFHANPIGRLLKDMTGNT